MMDDKILNAYLKAYKSETDLEPSTHLMKIVLGVPAQEIGANTALQKNRFNPWHWFDLMLPKAVGWALTGFMGIYIGLSSTAQVSNASEEEFMYDQALLMLTEDFGAEDTGAETYFEDEE